MNNNSIVTELGQSSSSARAVAYFRSSSLADHGHAISIQQDQVRQWAKERGIEIIHEFCDIGPLETDTTHRTALAEMVEEWIKLRSDFVYVLCFDANRLGRHLDSESLSDPASQIAQHNKQLICTSQASLPA